MTEQPDAGQARHRIVLAQLERDRGGVVVQCNHARDHGPARTLRLDACLAEVASYRLVDVVLAAGSAQLDVGQCPAAASRRELDDLAALLGPARLSVVMEPVVSCRGPLLDERRPPVDRRAALFLGSARRTAIGEHPRDSDAHQRLAESLREAGVEEPDLASPARRLVLAPSCTACGVCVNACPHDALDLQHSGFQSALHHSPSRCASEQECIRLCPHDALRDGGHHSWGDVLTGSSVVLGTVPTRTCTKCRTRFPDDDDPLCPQCRARARDPFGVHLPQEVLARLGRGPDGRRLDAGPTLTNPSPEVS